MVRGFASYGKKSWLTETSGEPSVWAPADEAALSDSALGLGVKAHQALTAGQESAWVYWQMLDDDPVSANTLTDRTLRERARRASFLSFRPHPALHYRALCRLCPLTYGGLWTDIA